MNYEKGYTLDTIGTFWPVGRPKRRLPGRLTFSPEDGGRLQIAGSFHDPKEVIARAQREADGSVHVGLAELAGLNAPRMRILGETTNGRVTLEECIEGQGTCHIALILCGAHISNNELLRFQAAEFGIREFVRWSGESGLDDALFLHERIDQIERIQITCNPVPEKVISIPGGQLTVRLPYDIHGDHLQEVAIRQNWKIERRFADTGSIQDVYRTHHSLQALISLGTSMPVTVNGTRVQLRNGDWLDLHFRHTGSETITQNNQQYRPQDVLFSYEDLNGLSGIARWLEISTKFWPVIGTVMTRWYAPDLHLELQFFNMVIAAEAFDRIRQARKERKRTLKKRLKAMTDLVGPAFHDVIKDADWWTTAVVVRRNEDVAHIGNPGRTEPKAEPLYWLTASVYILVVLCLLRQCGMTKDQLPNKRRCPWMATVAHKLKLIQSDV